MWPGFLFPLADPDSPSGAPLPPVAALATLTSEEQSELALDDNPAVNDPLERLDKLTVLVLRALRDDNPEPAPEPAVPIAAIPPVNGLEGWFVIRCVYERPACEPLHGEVMSDPTEPFQMAGFFDPDAPARPIRIGLPIDTTPGRAAEIRQEHGVPHLGHLVRPDWKTQGSDPRGSGPVRAAVAVSQGSSQPRNGRRAMQDRRRVTAWA